MVCFLLQYLRFFTDFLNRYGSVDMGAASKASEQRRIAEMNQQESHGLVTPVTTVIEVPETVEAAEKTR